MVADHARDREAQAGVAGLDEHALGDPPDEVAHRLAMRDRAFELLERLHLELEVGAKRFLDRLADAQPADQLKVGQALEEQDALGQPIGVLHLVDRFAAFERRQPLDAPIVEQPVM